MLCFRIRGYYPLGRAFPGTSSNSAFFYSTCYQRCSLITPIPNIVSRIASRDDIVVEFGLLPFRSPLLGE